MIVNLTPHPVTIAGVEIAPDGRIPRVSEDIAEVGRLVETAPGWWMRQHRDEDAMPDETRPVIPITRSTLGELVGLPERQPGTWLIVSRMVAEAAPDRDDLFFPGALLRDTTGRIIGAESLAVLR